MKQIMGNWIIEREEGKKEKDFYLYLGVLTPRENYLAVYAKINKEGEFKDLEIDPVLAFIVRINVNTFEEEHDVQVLPVIFSLDCLDVVIETREDPKFLGVVPERLFEELEPIYIDYGRRIADMFRKKVRKDETG
jgi:hypothetical protein